MDWKGINRAFPEICGTQYIVFDICISGAAILYRKEYMEKVTELFFNKVSF